MTYQKVISRVGNNTEKCFCDVIIGGCECDCDADCTDAEILNFLPESSNVPTIELSPFVDRDNSLGLTYYKVIF